MIKKPRKQKKQRVKKQKQQQILKDVEAILKGVVLEWPAVDPLSDERADITTDAVITHKNPVYKLMMRDIMRPFNRIIQTRTFLWRINIDPEFLDSFGKTYYRGTELLIQGRLDQTNDGFFSAVEELFAQSNMSQYITTHIRLEILGNRGAKEADFTA